MLMKENGKRILLVEDEALIALDEENILKKHGYRVITEYSGEDAVKRVNADTDIDLVLMDIDLGMGIDGTEAARRILEKRDVPVVFLSSHTEPDIVERTEGITSYGYVVKHSGETVLAASIKMAFKLFDAKRREEEKERRLRGMMEYTETLVQASPAFIVVISPEGRTLMMNESMLQALGYRSEEVVGSDYLSTFVPEEEREAVSEVFYSITRSRASTTSENIVIAKDGARLLVEWHGRFIHGLHDRDDFFFGIGMDITGRRGIENALRESEERFRTLAENANDVIYQMRLPEGVYEYVSPSSERVLGYAPADFYHNPGFIKRIIHPDWMQYFDEYWSAILHGEEPLSFEYKIVDKAGGARWMCQANSYIRDESGSIVRMQGIIRDITERKLMELDLQKSEELYRVLAQNSTDVIWTMNFEGLFQYISPSITVLAGYTPSEVVGTHFEKYVLPEYVQQIEAEMARELSLPNKERKRPFTKELRQYRKDGSIIDIEVTVSYMRDEKGVPVGIQGNIHDISARKAMERKLIERSDFLQKLIDAMPNPVFYKDINGKFLGFNKAFVEFTGFELDRTIGKTLVDLAQREVAREQGEMDVRVLELMETQVYETRLPHRDGTMRDVIMQKGVFTGPDGAPAGIIGSILDISDRKKTEEVLMSLLEETDRLKEQAENLHKEKELLLKEVHHRIKNNMSTIISLLNLHMSMMQDTPAEAELAEARNRIQSMMVLYDLLYRSTDYRDASMAEYLPFMVGEMIRVFPQSKRIRIQTSAQDFRIGVGKLVPLGIIINELISNSMKYAFSKTGEGRIGVQALQKDGKAEIIIEDDGIGIPETLSPGDSSGFGLRLVELLVKQLKGEMRLEREGGTRFVLRFPV